MQDQEYLKFMRAWYCFTSYYEQSCRRIINDLIFPQDLWPREARHSISSIHFNPSLPTSRYFDARYTSTSSSARTACSLLGATLRSKSISTKIRCRYGLAYSSRWKMAGLAGIFSGTTLVPSGSRMPSICWSWWDSFRCPMEWSRLLSSHPLQ